MNLQILVQPMWSKQEINSDSCYVLMTEFMRAALKVHTDWQFIVLFPDSKSDFKYDSDGFFSIPGVVRIPQRVSPRKLANAVTYDAVYYDQLFRNFGFDLVWCHLVEIASHLKHAGTASFEWVARPIVIASHNYVLHKSLPYPLDSLENVLLMQVMGGISADRNVFDSEHCRNMFMETSSEFIKESLLKEIMDRSMLIHHGILDKKMKPPVKNPDKIPVIIYNHRLQAYKQWRSTFEVFRELHEEGIKFRVIYTNSTTDNVAALSPYAGFTDIKLCGTRQEYLKVLATADLNVTNSLHETFCISAVESMAMGQPLIAPQGVTFPEITGQSETRYPYLFKNENEEKTMVRKLLADPQERDKWGKILSKYVTEHFNTEVWVENYSKLFMEEVLQRQVERERPELDEPVIQIIKGLRGQTLKQVFNELNGKLINGKHSIGNQSFSMAKMTRYMRKLGFTVHIENGAQRVY